MQQFSLFCHAYERNQIFHQTAMTCSTLWRIPHFKQFLPDTVKSGISQNCRIQVFFRTQNYLSYNVLVGFGRINT